MTYSASLSNYQHIYITVGISIQLLEVWYTYLWICTGTQTQKWHLWLASISYSESEKNQSRDWQIFHLNGKIKYWGFVHERGKLKTITTREISIDPFIGTSKNIITWVQYFLISTKRNGCSRSCWIWVHLS